VQGLTEFLPVSSDGHLAILQYFLTPIPVEDRLAITVALHLGTLLAVIIYFRRELVGMATTLLFGRRDGLPSIWLLALGTLPAAVIGVAVRDRIAATFDSLPVIGVGFLLTGSLLFFAGAVRGASRTDDMLGPWDALLIGVMQATALLPGISRSGTTISAGLFLKIRPDVAVRFSFLLAVPAISGAVALEGKAILALPSEMLGTLLAGMVVAAGTGLLAIAVLLRLIRGGKLRYFAYYCWALGAAVLTSSALGH